MGLRWKKHGRIMLLVAHHPEDEDEELQKGENAFFETSSTFEFLIFWLSYGT